ncbi:MAG: hypothetical protein UV82_C0007G0097 [Candidatus Magasanikbacteria bacterium GW2011_GWD2_43_18]|nr:MAG: hypothetical protein UV18_C0010G0010 [Candidatus Magasanikbacteria bacterium GW2011_GWC2_42_27]KKT04597.1 MAG: hypothetical protein UV82_C0007G0097 [Candidatus Magasanikbacteria bacterium GW2011_GWD2_43_18]KKT24443.1 MAG: hypothetical protein UW10_C0026G0010 [Candidatus Magasanikbacteria bacterium GW2011_GWA2_43_9]
MSNWVQDTLKKGKILALSPMADPALDLALARSMRGETQ